MMKRSTISIVLMLIATALATKMLTGQNPETAQAEREAMYYRYLEFPSYVKGGKVDPHWMADGNSFWYAEGSPANTVIWKVDPRANTKTPLFDTARLRQALTPLLGHEPPYQGLPFDKFTFMDGEKAVKFTVAGKEFILQLDTYKIVRAPVRSAEEKDRLVAKAVAEPHVGEGSAPMEVLSPDRKWFASVKDHNLWLRSTYDGRSIQITTDGSEDYVWGNVEFEQGIWASWSPNSLKVAIKRAHYRKDHKIPIVHWLKPEEEVEWIPYIWAEEPMRHPELFVVDILSKRQIRVDTGEDPRQSIIIVGWWPDGSELLFIRISRDFKRLELMGANPDTGATRALLTESQKTSVVGVEIFYGLRLMFSLFEGGKKFLWMSERDGWNHLYLYDREGNLIQQLTKGVFPVVRPAVGDPGGLAAIDEATGWVYFTAHGDQQRPYDTHLYRVNLEGEGFTRLTEALGRHSIQFSPSKQFFLDTHSTLDRPPVVELRKADGTLLQTLSRASMDALEELKWKPPEEFVVKAADGKTDLYGVLYKPYDFDPNQKYPVVEVIYGWPHLVAAQHSFHPRRFQVDAQALAQLGFIVLIVDGRGTPARGKEFQDVVYGNKGRYEIPDHVAALKQVAAKRPYMDLGRVGIFGSSGGGYFTLRAMLLAPDVYHVGVARVPIVHIGFPAAQYMGLPENNKEGYEYASNLRFAGNLKGKLLIIHGTSDPDSPFSHTMKMVEALIRAGKPYDLIVLPEQGHRFTGKSAAYAQEAIRRYFQEHLKP